MPPTTTPTEQVVFDRSGSDFDDLGHQTPIADLAALVELVQQLPPAPVIVEVGSWAGASARTMAEASDSEARIYCVDHWHGNVESYDPVCKLAQHLTPLQAFRAFCRNMDQHLFRKVIPLVGTSRHWADLWPEHIQVDMVYLDGDHRYQAVKADILAWQEHLKPGGILAGHDYGIFDGVTRAVDQCVGDQELVGHCVWFTRK